MMDFILRAVEWFVRIMGKPVSDFFNDDDLPDGQHGWGV